LQSSPTIDPACIQNTDDGELSFLLFTYFALHCFNFAYPAFAGQNPPVTGQTGADVSKNNFANLCALGLPKVPLTNGLQITTGSCNPIPIGNIPSVDNMPSSKFRACFRLSPPPPLY
jgi:hypothetical protein